MNLPESAIYSFNRTTLYFSTSHAISALFDYDIGRPNFNESRDCLERRSPLAARRLRPRKRPRSRSDSGEPKGKEGPLPSEQSTSNPDIVPLDKSIKLEQDE